jgi:putative nucleotidyltransferase with HDIG domain
MPLSINSGMILSSMEKLPAFPFAIGDLLRDLNDENASALTLSRHIEHDPVLIGRILGLANRLLRDEGRPAARDVYTAVSIIGFSRIRQIVLTTSIAHFTSFFHQRQAFWEHCLAVGVACEELARFNRIDLTQALVAGLLHDIGKLWMAYFHPFEFQKVSLRVQAHGTALCEEEELVFGISHCEIGHTISQAWKLPEEISQAIRFHHGGPVGMPACPLVQIVYLAEMLCNALDIPYRAVNQVGTLLPWAQGCLPMDDEAEMHALFGRIEARFRFAQGFFH